jgi:hypothetical protein
MTRSKSYVRHFANLLALWVIVANVSVAHIPSDELYSFFIQKSTQAYEIFNLNHTIDSLINLPISPSQSIIRVIKDQKEEKSTICLEAKLIYNITKFQSLDGDSSTAFWDSLSNSIYVSDRRFLVTTQLSEISLTPIENSVGRMLKTTNQTHAVDFRTFKYFRLEPIENTNDEKYSDQFLLFASGKFLIYNENLKFSLYLDMPEASNSPANFVFHSQIFDNQFLIGHFDADRVLLTFHRVIDSLITDKISFLNLGKFITLSQAKSEKISFALSYNTSSKSLFLFFVVKRLGMLRFIFDNDRKYFN